MTTGIMDFDSFAVGMTLGSETVDVAPLVAEWAALFPGTCDADGLAPSGLLVAIMMRGYLTLLDRRPPGNIHAGQRLRWGVAAASDAPVTVSLRCIAKERKGDRPWITFAATVAGAGGEQHLAGEMRSLWAA